MSLKITMTVDEEHGEQLVGLLAKAFGRGELGIGDMRIERAEPLDVGLKTTAAIHPIRKSTVAKLVAAGTRKSNRASAGLGARAFKTGKPNGAVTILTGLSHDASRDGLKAVWTARGFSENGLGAMLSKLAKRGYVIRVDEGQYRLTPKGADVVNRWEDRSEGHPGVAQ
jgi:hypothetical protein